MNLTQGDMALLEGEAGEGPALAMNLLIALGNASGAPELIDIASAHVDGCLYHGQAGVDFAAALVDGGARVAVPTTLNVSSLDLLHPDLYRGNIEKARAARDLMDLHVQLGCSPTWTCAPYQLQERPVLGAQIAWGESNAIVFANSVLGARTNRYGDFADLACAVTGRAPNSGLHTDQGRAGSVIVQLAVPNNVLELELFYPLLGHWIGANTGNKIPVIVGLDRSATEDRLKAMGAAAASSGSTAMFHAVGVTPEAPTVDDATQGRECQRLSVDVEALVRIFNRLSTGNGRPAAVSVGTPHMSSDEVEALIGLVRGRKSMIPFYVNTSRDVIMACKTEHLDALDDFGATVVTDTCTYITPIMGKLNGPVLTNSAKWAYYAPANIGIDVVLASLAGCVESATTGKISSTQGPFS